MNRTWIRGVRRLAGDRRGVALPLALLGLVAVSLLVTTALVTSSTELAISSAHADATRSLYVAEGGLQAYVATRGTALISDTGRTFVFRPPSGGDDESVDVTVTYLGEHARADLTALRTFSVEAASREGGARRVAVLVRQNLPAPVPLNTDIRSAITLGGNLDVNGNAFTVTGRSTACGSAGVQAVRHATSSVITVNNNRHWDNFAGVDSLGNLTQGRASVRNSGLTKEQLVAQTLGLAPGQTLNDLIARIPDANKWGPRFRPPVGPVRVFDGRVDAGELVAVVDADGGTLDLLGGTGLLIVVNGNVEMRGNAVFNGIIIVERNFRLAGTPSINGALISLGEQGQNEIVLDASAIANGHITVQYDRCRINDAQEGFRQLALRTLPPTVLDGLTWQEIAR